MSAPTARCACGSGMAPSDSRRLGTSSNSELGTGTRFRPGRGSDELPDARCRRRRVAARATLGLHRANDSNARVARPNGDALDTETDLWLATLGRQRATDGDWRTARLNGPRRLATQARLRAGRDSDELVMPGAAADGSLRVRLSACTERMTATRELLGRMAMAWIWRQIFGLRPSDGSERLTATGELLG